jgi:hypothetical protein
MLVTDLAYRDMEACADGIVAGAANLMRRVLCPNWLDARGARVDMDAVAAPHLQIVPMHEPPVTNTAATDADRFRWRKHPQLRDNIRDAADREDLERGTRSAAVRGLFLARSGRLDEARKAFAVAAGDPGIDLTAIPGFWDLSRGGMLAAASAYEDTDRFREAASLAARVRIRYRPRTVTALPVVPARRSATSGT